MTTLSSRQARQLSTFLDRHADEQLDFLIALTEQNSYSYHKAGTDRIAEMILDSLGGILPTVRRVVRREVGDLILLSNAQDAPSIFLLGHRDTVFPPDHPFRHCRLEENRLHGPGAGDMKAGLAALTYALLALDHVGLLSTVPVTVALTGDEEIGSPTSRAVFEEERGKALACLVVEGGGPAGEIVVSRFGKMGLRLECEGRDAHVGGELSRKASAIAELAHKILGLEALNGALPEARVNVGKVEGGLGPATVPAAAHALVDLRWKEQAHRDPLLQGVEEVVRREDVAGCSSRVQILNERPAWPFHEGTRRLATLVQEAGRAMGLEVGLEHRKATSDSNFFGAAGVPTVDGLGPLCQGYHTPEEFVRVDTLRPRTELLARSLVAVAEAFGGKGAGVEA